MVYRKIRSKIICIVVCTLIHSSFCVLNSVLPACSPDFAEVTATSKRLAWPDLEDVLLLSITVFLNLSCVTRHVLLSQFKFFLSTIPYVRAG